MRLNFFHYLFRIVNGKFLNILTATNIEINDGIIIGNKNLTYKVIYNLLLVVFVVYVTFKQFFDKRTDEQNLKSITAKIAKIRQEVSELTDAFVKAKSVLLQNSIET